MIIDQVSKNNRKSQWSEVSLKRKSANLFFFHLLAELLWWNPVDRLQRLHHHVFLLQILKLSLLVHRPAIDDEVALAIGRPGATSRLNRPDLIADKVVANDEAALWHVQALLCDVSGDQKVAALCRAALATWDSIYIFFV